MCVVCTMYLCSMGQWLLNCNVLWFLALTLELTEETVVLEVSVIRRKTRTGYYWYIRDLQHLNANSIYMLYIVIYNIPRACGKYLTVNQSGIEHSTVYTVIRTTWFSTN